MTATKQQPFGGVIVESEKHQRALGAFYRANYERNVRNGWPTAEANAAR